MLSKDSYLVFKYVCRAAYLALFSSMSVNTSTTNSNVVISTHRFAPLGVPRWR